MNPNAIGRMPTVLKLYAYGHECGHFVVGMSRPIASTGLVGAHGARSGMVSAPGLPTALIQMFANNPGDLRHPPGPVRVQHMMDCYQQP